jgi:hypothetical protein
MVTGNPNGDTGNATATSAQNVLQFTNSGSLNIISGTSPNTSLGQSTSSIFVQNYGTSTSNLVSIGSSLFVQRARGNRDGNLSVQPSDELGKLTFVGHNGSSYQTTRPTQVRIVVDSTYVANSANIPTSIKFDTYNSANTLRTTSINSNGNITMASGAFLNTDAAGQVALGIGSGITSQASGAIAIGTDAGNITACTSA